MVYSVHSILLGVLFHLQTDPWGIENYNIDYSALFPDFPPECQDFIAGQIACEEAKQVRCCCCHYNAIIIKVIPAISACAVFKMSLKKILNRRELVVQTISLPFLPCNVVHSSYRVLHDVRMCASSRIKIYQKHASSMLSNSLNACWNFSNFLHPFWTTLGTMNTTVFALMSSSHWLSGVRSHPLQLKALLRSTLHPR